MSATSPRRRALLTFLLIFVPFLLFLGWSQASFDLSFIRPRNASETILLLTLSALIFVAFAILALVLLRILLKLYAERRQGQLGSRFKTKMVVAFLALSLIPVCFLFFLAYGLLNRSLDKWFGIPFDVLRQDARVLSQQVAEQSEQRALDDAAHLGTEGGLRAALARKEGPALQVLLARDAADLGLSAAFCFDERGRLAARVGPPAPSAGEVLALFPQLATGQVPPWGITAFWQGTSPELVLAARPLAASRGASLGSVVSVRRLPLDVQRTSQQIEQETQRYDALSREQKAVKRVDLMILGLVTLLILFAATWFAMFVSRQVTVPIQALVEGTHQVSQGNLGFQVMAQADGELSALIDSFNQMTRQLAESRRALEQAAADVQQVNRKLEERTTTIESILENIPTGVVSLNPQGEITNVNSTMVQMLNRPQARSARALTELFSADDAAEMLRLLPSAYRQGTLTRQTELDLGGRRVTVALTVSSIRARHGNVGYVLVLEDLTELLRAQKSAAWREVAQRLAHEIKNPLTPIQLSAERIQRLIGRAGRPAEASERTAALLESSALIGREVANLKALVDEFSRFARFPNSRPVPADVNAIVESALNVFDGRLDGIQVQRELARGLPAVAADPEQMKRALVNLIDNAAEALEHAPVRRIWIRTALDAERELVELVVADSGPGISPEVKEKLFLPYFSTKRRGTGLGLAIVHKIVSEHQGCIRVEENRPWGAKFTIELPVARPGPALSGEA